ncbi:MAG: hypothetical protein IID05_14035, partial [Gemmatimonadetes bacterium]|nr:hypothetical protein [Gemmatimonadota bacterium]
MSSNAKNGFDRRLMTVTQQCAEEVELHGLVRSVGEALADVPNLCTAGVAVFDDERQAVQRYTVRLTPASAASPQDTKGLISEEEFPLGETEISALLDGSSVAVVDLKREHRTSLGDRLRAGGVRHYVSASILLRGKLLGALFVASTHHQKIPDSVVAGVKDLAKVVTPILCNCLNQLRFARGDRRRDVLIELSNVVNSSLELDTVLTHAGRVLGSLDGHRMSAICLLNEGNRTYRSHQIHGAAGTARV